MKYLAGLLILVGSIVPSAHADHRKLTFVPRLAGRTAVDMLLFKDKTAATEQ